MLRNLLRYRKEVPTHTAQFLLCESCAARFAQVRMQYLYYHTVTARLHRPSFGAGAD